MAETAATEQQGQGTLDRVLNFADNLAGHFVSYTQATSQKLTGGAEAQGITTASVSPVGGLGALLTPGNILLALGVLLVIKKLKGKGR